MMIEDPHSVAVTLHLTRPQAQALAQFVKRTTHSACEEIADNDNQAYLMMDGVNELMNRLADAGFNPR